MKRWLSVAVVTTLLAAGLATAAQEGPFKPVTRALTENPDPADWIHWRRTLDGWGFSPLNQITTANVHQLQLAWAWTLNTGPVEPGPLVHSGVMYVQNPVDGAVALDAATGDLLWEYRREPPERVRGLIMMRSLAIFDDKVYFTTHDAHIVALNARTGTVVWDHVVADHDLGYGYTSGPLAAAGKIIAGMGGCEREKEDVCFISAHDPNTGRELWRTSTIARPGEPGGDTWSDLPLRLRKGGDAWIPGSYDPRTNVLYWAAAQAKPWARGQRRSEGNELYTNSVLAIDPDTGKILWHRQLIPGDSYDQDEVFENVLIDYRGRNSLFKMGKLGILWEVDRTDGRVRAAHDIGYQTLYDVDPETGALTFHPDATPRLGDQVNWCPSTSGFKDWRAMAYHPSTQAFYIPLNVHCSQSVFHETPLEGSGYGRQTNTRHFHPKSPDNLGEFLAITVDGTVLWRHRTRTPMDSAALTTGGGLAIVGDWDRNLYVHDARTGKVLYSARMPGSVQGFPIAYAVNGRQFIAVPVAARDLGGWSNLVASLAPEKKRPLTGNGIYVFALPAGATAGSQ